MELAVGASNVVEVWVAQPVLAVPAAVPRQLSETWHAHAQQKSSRSASTSTISSGRRRSSAPNSGSASCCLFSLFSGSPNRTYSKTLAFTAVAAYPNPMPFSKKNAPPVTRKSLAHFPRKPQTAIASTATMAPSITLRKRQTRRAQRVIPNTAGASTSPPRAIGPAPRVTHNSSSSPALPLWGRLTSALSKMAIPNSPLCVPRMASRHATPTRSDSITQFMESPFALAPAGQTFSSIAANAIALAWFRIVGHILIRIMQTTLGTTSD